MNGSDGIELRAREKQVEFRTKKRKCLHHPAMQCPTPDDPCVFTKMKKSIEV